MDQKLRIWLSPASIFPLLFESQWTFHVSIPSLLEVLPEHDAVNGWTSLSARFASFAILKNIPEWVIGSQRKIKKYSITESPCELIFGCSNVDGGRWWKFMLAKNLYVGEKQGTQISRRAGTSTSREALSDTISPTNCDRKNSHLSVYCWHLHAGFDCCGSHLITPFWFLYFLCSAFLQFRSTDRPFFRCIEIFISELPFLATLNGHFCTFWSFLSSKLSQRRFHVSDTTLPRVTLLTQTALNGYDGDLLLKASFTIFELQTHSS